jgi:hypothetical protein
VSLQGKLSSVAPKLIAIGLSGLIIGATWWLLVRNTRGAEIANVLALPVAIAGLAVTMVGLRTSPVRIGHEAVIAAAQELANKVREQEGLVLSQLLFDAADAKPANIAYRQPELVKWRTDGGLQTGTLADIEQYFRGLQRGRLVVLGEPGSGKTVLVLQFILSYLKTQEARGELVRVPVRLSLAAFDPRYEIDDSGYSLVETAFLSSTFDEWITEHIRTVYGLRPATAKALVRQGIVLPVLDGLDEMDGELRQLRSDSSQRATDGPPVKAAAVLKALNHPTPSGVRRFVLTSRTERYRELLSSANIGDIHVVEDATVVHIDPLRACR